MQPLFRDLDQVLRSAVRPIADFLSHYARVSSQFLLGLEQELAFYVGAVHFVNRLRDQGLPLCSAEFAPDAECVSQMEGIYNVNLALRMGARGDTGTRGRGDAEKGSSALRVGEGGQVGKPVAQEDGEQAGGTHGMVLNDIYFGEEGRVFVLTGPNRGGKTTFTQAVGLAHVLHQAGLLVPAKRARLSPVDAILTHFPMAEEYSRNAGRLGEEAQRLEAIFRRATPHSLVLLNESLFSTSPGESLYLARDVVRALRYLGTRAIFATHLHELAANVDEINQQTPGTARVASLVATVERAEAEDGGAGRGNADIAVASPTFRIEPGPPMGLSYARQIATRYGISFEQLAATIDGHVG